MSDPVISVAGIGKEYVLGVSMSGNMLREQIASGVRKIFQRVERPNRQQQRFWALKDVSFRVDQGEVVGVIGHNGAGKSTLLKVLSEITEPSTGEIRVRGRIASLLEVGTGFHPELSGRENIYLNGAILGMTRSEISRKFDEIVAFSGVERFLETPVKRFSSGMYVRLAFSVAAHLEPEILVIDEVLAVGDLEFQKRCLGKMGDVARSGRTVLFVSHNMTAIHDLCERSLLLNHGELVADGATGDVINGYLSGLNTDASIKRKVSNDADAWVTDVRLIYEGSESRQGFKMGQSLCVEISYETKKKVEHLGFGISIEDCIQSTRVFASVSSIHGIQLENVEGEGRARVCFPDLKLVPGRYMVTITLNAKSFQYDRLEGVRILDVLGQDELGTGWVLSRQRNGVVWLNHEWLLDGRQ